MDPIQAEHREMRPSGNRELIERLRRGEAEAQRELYVSQKDAVFSAIYRLVQNTSDAADLTHDAFISAFERIGQLEDPAALYGWLRKLATRRALEGIRLIDRRRGLLNRRHSGPTFARPCSLDGVELEAAISRLPEKLRIIFLLHAVEGYQHSEIADELGITPVASRARLGRARKKLIEALRLNQEHG